MQQKNILNGKLTIEFIFTKAQSRLKKRRNYREKKTLGVSLDVETTILSSIMTFSPTTILSF